jgi:hypothetical protein
VRNRPGSCGWSIELLEGEPMSLAKLLSLWASLLLACRSGPPVPGLECLDPPDCGGSPCCWSSSVLGQSSACTAGSGSCVPVLGVDTIKTRLCQVDADCTSGGISSPLSHCCQRSEIPTRACLETCP